MFIQHQRYGRSARKTLIHITPGFWETNKEHINPYNTIPELWQTNTENINPYVIPDLWETNTENINLFNIRVMGDQQQQKSQFI